MTGGQKHFTARPTDPRKMPEFLRFLLSLGLVLVRYIQSRYVTSVRRLYAKLAALVVRHREPFILVPVVLGFALAYPSAYRGYWQWVYTVNKGVNDVDIPSVFVFRGKLIAELVGETTSYVIQLQWLRVVQWILVFSNVAVWGYTLLQLNSLTTITSKWGLLLACVAQESLAIFISNTFILLDPILQLLIVINGVTTMLRLLITISELPGELNVPEKLAKALERCGLKSSLIAIIVATVLYQSSPGAALAVTVDHLLHLTFFTSILSIDIHRLELEDLIELKPVPKMNWSLAILGCLLYPLRLIPGELVQTSVINSVWSMGSKVEIIVNVNAPPVPLLDGYIVLEILTLLVFIVSVTMIALKHFTTTLPEQGKKVIEQQHALRAKILGAHLLDVIRIITSKSPYIVSVGLDHRILVWSPLAQPMPSPWSVKAWPVSDVVLSDHGDHVAVFTRDNVECWSRGVKLWSVEAPRKVIVSFFRQRTQRTAANRRNLSRSNSLRSVDLPMEDFVMVLKDEIVTVSGGELVSESIPSIVSSNFLVTPRINDRLVSVTTAGELLVSTAVNNKWKSRVVTVHHNKFNNPYAEPQTKPLVSYSQITVVPFVGFIVRTSGALAELIDVQTGIVIKSFPITSNKGFKVVHDPPTHCRFCGSVSIASLSVAYMSNELTVHTFTPNHNAKTSICLRVERDPREIRCVGFDSVTETVNSIPDVEVWSTTDTQIMGVLRDWRGFTFHGTVDTFDIPPHEGLLVNSVTEIAKFGHKSVVVAFGNVMKILYRGNNDLVYDDKPVGGLSFVERRRRRVLAN